MVFISLLSINSSIAQDNYGMIVEYDMNLEFRKYPYYKAKLMFDSNASLFTYKSKQLVNQEREDDFGNLSIVISDPVKYVVYTEKKNKKFYEIQSNISNYGIDDQKQKIKWEFVKDTIKTIGKFKCNLAKAKVKGRLYYSWYSLDLPSNVGPWKLHGLPGLILQAYDSNNRVSFSVTKISRLKNEMIGFPRSEYKWISKEEFDKIQLKKIEEVMIRMAAKNSRGEKFKYKVDLGEQIELK